MFNPTFSYILDHIVFPFLIGFSVPWLIYLYKYRHDK